MALVDPKLRKRMTKLQKSLGRRTTPQSKARVQSVLDRLAKKRRAQVELGTLYNPSASASPQMLKGMVDSLTAGEVAPLERQRAAAQAGGDKSIADIEAVFRTIGQSQAAALQASGQIGQRAVDATRAAGQAQTQAGAAAAAQAQADIDRDAALRGQANVGDARERLATAVATRTADNAALQSARESFTGNIVASGQNLLAQMNQAQQMRGAELAAGARGELANRIAEINAKIADVKGPGRTEKILKLRGDERQWLGEQAAFRIDQKKLAQQTAIQKASIHQRDVASKRTATQRAADRRQRARDKALDRKVKRDLAALKGTGGAGARTPSQVREDQRNANKAIADVRNFNRAKNGRAAKRTDNGRRLRQRAIDGLMADYGYSREQATAIVRRTLHLDRPPKKAHKKIRP